METWQPAYIGVGSNLDNPRAQVLSALRKLADLPTTRVVTTSPLYGSRPMGPADQPDYVNAVAGILTQLDSRALLTHLRAIESAAGRPDQRQKWGPRVIDLDVLVYGRERRDEPDLVIPHPGIVERNFVLYPLADIAPDLDVPGLGRVSELKSRLASDGLHQI
jgi:2-amino-4-hydroxy-6-hydroxymethyldihydropteridine diphosphokinase